MEEIKVERNIKELNGTWMFNKENALKTFEEVLNTPMARAIHFTFNAEVNCPSTVEYTVERFAFEPRKDFG